MLLQRRSVNVFVAIILVTSVVGITVFSGNSGATGIPPSHSTSVSYLNATSSSYFSSGIVQSGVVNISAVENPYPNTWAFNGVTINNGSPSQVSYTYNLGNYQYWAGTGIGDGAGTGDPAPGQFVLEFNAGINSAGQANIGTIYTNFTLRNTTTLDIAASHIDSQVVNTTYTGNSEIYQFSPYWYPTVKSGIYDVGINVTVTPATNYGIQNPNDLSTVSLIGVIGGPVEGIHGWTYSGTTAGFPIHIPSNALASSFNYYSTYAVSTNINGTISNQMESNSLFLYSSSYTSGQFQNVVGDPNVTSFEINYNLSNVVTEGNSTYSGVLANDTISENQNWFNATIEFKLTSPNGALNGAKMDGKQWNSTLTYSISDILDSAYNISSPVNNFYINGKIVNSPKEYNNFSGHQVIINGTSTYFIYCFSSELVNYYPSLIDSYVSSQTVYLGENLTFTVNVSEIISGERAMLTVNWEDGSIDSTNLTTSTTILANHSYGIIGNFTPKITITNVPLGGLGGLTNGSYNLPKVTVLSIPYNGTTTEFDVNPKEKVQFNITSDANISGINDSVRIAYGDGSFAGMQRLGNYTFVHSYLKTGNYQPIIQIFHGTALIESKNLHVEYVLPIRLNQSVNLSDGISRLTLSYQSFVDISKISLFYNGSEISSELVSGSSGNMTYNFTGSFVNSNYFWQIETIDHYIQNSTNLPQILSFYAWVNPISVGSSTNFLAYINDATNYSVYVNGQMASGGYYGYNYTFKTAGNYTVTLVAINGNGISEDSFVERVIVPVPSFGVSYSSVTREGTPVTYSLNINWQGLPGTVEWILDNSTDISNTTQFNYTYYSVGTYYITIVVSNKYTTRELNITTTVNPFPLPVISSIHINPTTVYTGKSVTFTAEINWENAGGNMTWEINGSRIEGNTYIFNSAGNYTLTLRATNSFGESSFYNVTINVYPQNKGLTNFEDPYFYLSVASAIGVVIVLGLIFYRKRIRVK